MNVVGGESAVFTHFQDVTTKISMISGYCIMWGKRTIEGTNMHAKKAETAFNLKTMRLNMGWMKVTINKIYFVERGK